MQYVCKKDKINQVEIIWKCKYKATIMELEGLKDKYKEMEKEKKDVDRKFASIKEVYNETKIQSEQTKIKLKNLYCYKETYQEFIKALRSMKKTKIDSVLDKELRIKQLQARLKKRKNKWKECKKKTI